MDGFMHLSSHVDHPERLTRVPYRCSEPYDQQGFLTYPIRAGWPQVLPSADDLTFGRYDIGHRAEDDKLEDFLERWIFFGLLHEIIGDTAPETRYTSEDDDGKFLQTKHLIEDLEEWTAKVLLYSADRKAALRSHLQECLGRARETVRVTAYDRHKAFNRAIRQCLATVCETVCFAIDLALPHQDGELDLPMAWGFIYKDQQVEKAMEDNGWCPSEALKALSSVLMATSMYLLQHLDRPRQDHRQCNNEICYLLTTDEETYQPQHVNGCDCHQYPILLAQIGACIDSGGIPLLKITGQSINDLCVEVVSSTNNKYWMALSHVWADGLGNKQGNALPACQVLQLQQLIINLRDRVGWNASQPETREILLWCDTLCVPIEDKNNDEQTRIRKVAMEKMRMAYEKSTYVVVLDKTLQPFAVEDIGMTNAALRAITSPWMHRLWTFQEAVLPKNLLFQFADTAIDIREMWQAHSNLRNSDLRLRGVSVDVISWCRTIKLPYYASANSSRADLGSLVKSLRHRSVSDPSDEPLCITTLLNLDMSKLLAGSKNQRMETLWGLIQDGRRRIHKDIIFNLCPRLATPGFRWAPASLLHDPTDSLFRLNMSDDDERVRAHIRAEGLQVMFRALDVRHAEPPPGLPSDIWSPLRAEGQEIYLAGTDQTWHRISRVPNDVLSPGHTLRELIAASDQDVILILDREAGQGLSPKPYLYQGVLCHRTKSEPSPVLKSLARVGVEQLIDHQRSHFAKAQELAQQLRNDPLVTQQIPALGLQRADKLDRLGLMQQLYDQLMQLVNTALQNAEFAQSIAQLGAVNVPIVLGAYTARHFMGHYYTTSDTVYPPDTEWIID